MHIWASMVFLWGKVKEKIWHEILLVKNEILKNTGDAFKYFMLCKNNNNNEQQDDKIAIPSAWVKCRKTKTKRRIAISIEIIFIDGSELPSPN